jgi:hypothetical protein
MSILPSFTIQSSKPVAAKFRDEIRVRVLWQHRHMVPGIYLLPIGVAHELIVRGIAEVAPEFSADYSLFLRS